MDIIFHIAVNFQCSLGCYSPSSCVVAKDATMRERERERERVAVELLVSKIANARGIRNTHNNNNNSLAPFFFTTTCMIQQAHEFSCLFFSLIFLWVFLVFSWGCETNLMMTMRIYSASSLLLLLLLLLLLEIWVLDCSGKRREIMMMMMIRVCAWIFVARAEGG